MNPLLVPLHGLGSRQDLPLPLPAAIGGAALVLIVSFAVLALAWRTPRWDGVAGGLPLPGLTRVVDSGWFRAVLAALGLFVFAWVAMALWFGQDRVTNPVFGFTYVWLWVGLVPVSLLCGPLLRAANPWGLVARLLPRDGLRPLSSAGWRRVGGYPAAVGLLGFSWLELVQPDNNTLPVLRWWWLAWVVWVLAGTVAFGRRWVSAAEPFAAYAVLVSRASPWQRIDGTVHLVNPLRHLATSPSPAGTWAIVAALLGGTAFDGFTATSWWVRTTQTSGVPREVWGTAGLAVMVVLVAATLALGVRGLGSGPAVGDPGVRRDDGSVQVPLAQPGQPGFAPGSPLARRQPAPAPGSPPAQRHPGPAPGSPPAQRHPGPAPGSPTPTHLDLLAASVIPIVIGYAVAHYLSLLVLEGQRTLINLSDPLGLGWNAFGTAELGIDQLWLGTPSITATLQLLAIVGGHVLGVLVAHELSLRVLPAARRTVGQVPLLLVMIGYTCGGLLLLFSP